MKQVLMDSLRTLLGLLPFVATVAWANVFRFQRRHDFREWRWSLALACILLGTFVLAVTEVLSSAHCLNAGCAVLAWSVYLLIPLVILSKKYAVIDVPAEVARVAVKLKQVPFWMLGIILLLGSVMLVMAVASPPMNFDVQSYHLPRQVFWLMQGSVSHYDATYPFQNSHPVLAEFLGLNLMLLSGGDAWHNLICWVYLVGSCGLVTLITKWIGGGARAQALAVIFSGLVPAIFFQASNSKNDLVVAFYILMALAIAIVVWCRIRPITVVTLLLVALSAGLAMATKGTALAYLPACGVLLLVSIIRERAWKTLGIALIPGLLLCVLPMLPNTLRNARTFGSVAGPNQGMVNGAFGPGETLAVAIKDLGNQFACGPEEMVLNVDTAVRRVLHGLGINPDDPLTNMGSVQTDGTKLKFLYIPGCEDVIPAPVQTALCLLLPFAFFSSRFRKGLGTVAMGWVLIGSMLLFFTLFRWQPWIGRLLTPGFLMAAPLVGKALTLLTPRWVAILLAAGELMFLQAHMLSHGTRHLEGGRSIFALSKESQMSIAMNGRYEEIRSVMDHLKNKGLRQILVDGHDTPNYGLLRQLRLTFPQVMLRSGPVQHPGQADAIVDVCGTPVATDSGELKGYQLIWSGKFYSLYLRNQ